MPRDGPPPTSPRRTYGLGKHLGLIPLRRGGQNVKASLEAVEFVGERSCRRSHCAQEPIDLVVDSGSFDNTTVGLGIALRRAAAQLELPDCAKRMAQRMDGAEFPSETLRRLRGRHHHLSARRHVAAVVPPHGWRCPRSVERNRLGRHNVARREQGLDVVRHRIERGAAVSAPAAKASACSGSQ